MIETRIVPRVRDLGGGFQVRRALPDAARRSIGPFVFFDQMGPVALEPVPGDTEFIPLPEKGPRLVDYP